MIPSIACSRLVVMMIVTYWALKVRLGIYQMFVAVYSDIYQSHILTLPYNLCITVPTSRFY